MIFNQPFKELNILNKQMTEVLEKMLGGEESLANVLYVLIGENYICTDCVRGKWYEYNDNTSLWESKIEMSLHKKFIETLRQCCDDFINDNNQNEHIKKEFKKVKGIVGSVKKITDITKYLRSYCYSEEFEENKNNYYTYLLPIQNKSVVDLRTNEVFLRQRDHYFTIECPVYIGQNMYRAQVEQFFGSLMKYDDEKIRSLQIALGSFLTGECIKLLFIACGKGNNGKSKAMEIVSLILGSLYTELPDSVLIKSSIGSRANEHTAQLIPLVGKRLSVQPETERNEKINTKLVNRITGGEKIPMRSCGGEDFVLRKLYTKLVIYSNHSPEFDGTDTAVLNRLRYYSFDAVFSKTPSEGEYQADDHLIETLKTVGINDVFNWLLIGAKLFYDNCKDIPIATVDKTALDSYCSENDHIKEFMYYHTEPNDTMDVKIKDLYVIYDTWKKCGKQIYNKTNFKKYFEQRKEYTVIYPGNYPTLKGIYFSQ